MLEATLLDRTSFHVSSSAMNVLLFYSGIYKEAGNRFSTTKYVNSASSLISQKSTYKLYVLLSHGFAKDGRGRGRWTQKSVALGRGRARAGTWASLLGG